MSRLLTVEEVAQHLRITTTTVYRWLRSGKISAIKIGKEWRIDEDTLTAFLTQQQHQMVDANIPFWSNLNKSEHLMVLTSSQQEVFELEAAFFSQALKQGGRILKGCWWQDEDEVRQKLSDSGIDMDVLEAEGLFSLVNLKRLYQQQGVHGPVMAWYREIEKTRSLGFAKLWASGSPHLLSCGDGDCTEILTFESQLNNTLANMPVIGICPYCLDDYHLANFGHLISLMQHHSGTVFYSRGQSTLLRNVI